MMVAAWAGGHCFIASLLMNKDWDTIWANAAAGGSRRANGAAATQMIHVAATKLKSDHIHHFITSLNLTMVTTGPT